jgi:hypothetical protein
VRDNILSLDLVQDFAYLLRRVLVMVEKRDEVRNGTLEIDVIFPERVVSVDQESLLKYRHFDEHEL